MTSTRRIRHLVQMCFDKAVDKLRELKQTTDADALETATVHWLRRTAD